MGTFLATSLLAVPLIAWLSGTFFVRVPQLELARISSAPRGNFPASWNSNFSAAAPRSILRTAAARWMR